MSSLAGREKSSGDWSETVTINVRSEVLAMVTVRVESCRRAAFRTSGCAAA